MGVFCLKVGKPFITHRPLFRFMIYASYLISPLLPYRLGLTGISGCVGAEPRGLCPKEEKQKFLALRASVVREEHVGGGEEQAAGLPAAPHSS